MSNSFGSTNLFGSTAGSTSSARAPTYAPHQLGLRQRHNASSTTSNNANDDHNAAMDSDENANPNRSAARDWRSMSKVPAPPRASLATAGKSAFLATRMATATARQQQQQQQQQQQRPVDSGTNTESNQRAIVSRNEREEEDLSLWVIGYGYRDEYHFRALYHRLESCGTITARRGGLSCFGEGDAAENDCGNNWVAVRYESALCAQKALCQREDFVRVGGSVMVVGVMSLNESDAAAMLGINVKNDGRSQEMVTLSGPRNDRARRGLRTEADVLLYGDDDRGGMVDEDAESGVDSLCGKVLAWFFMWDTQY